MEGRTRDQLGPHPVDAAAGAGEATATGPVDRWFGDHARVIDGVVATLIFGYDLMYLASVHALGAVAGRTAFVALVVISATISVLYVLRRRAPLACPVTILVASWGYVFLGVGPSPGPLVLQALVLYFLGTRFGWKVLLPAVVAVSVWTVTACAMLLQSGYLRIGEIGVLVLAHVLAAFMGASTRARRRHVAGLQEVARRLARERDAQARVAAAEERARIAREIHDIVSHGLGTMVVAADGARVTVDADPARAKVMMTQVRDTGRAAMTDMRRMLDVLRNGDEPELAPQPGLDALDRLVEPLRSTGLRVDVGVSGEPRPLPAGVDLAAYRIVQEALTNARRHGGPMLSRVEVWLHYADSAVEVRVVDDGQGPPDASTRHTERDGRGSDAPVGHGLVGMRERVAAYDGKLTLRPRPDGGFEVRAVLPTGGDT